MLKNLNPLTWWLKIDEKIRMDLLMVLICIFVGLISFGLGRLSVHGSQKEPVEIEYKEVIPSTPASVTEAIDTLSGDTIVASKSGKRYHFGRCSGAKTIAVKNRIIFKTVAEAESAGYTLASNCK